MDWRIVESGKPEGMRRGGKWRRRIPRRKERARQRPCERSAKEGKKQ